MFRFQYLQKKCNSYRILHKLNEWKIQYHIIYILAVNIIRKRGYKCKTSIAPSLVDDMASLAELPLEVLVYYIFPYLRTEDIFTIGECSEKCEKDCFRQFTSSVVGKLTILETGENGVIERRLYMTMRLPSEIWRNVQNMIVNVRNFLTANIW